MCSLLQDQKAYPDEKADGRLLLPKWTGRIRSMRVVGVRDWFGQDSKSIRFLFEGERIQPTNTPDEVTHISQTFD